MISKKIYYGKQYIDKKDINAVKIALSKKLITTGNSVATFEKEIRNFTKSKYAITCSSGTAALHIALFSIDLKPNDIIIMPVINFISSYAMASSMNAKIYLADVCPDSGHMRTEDLLKCIKDNKIKKIKSVINMYIGGGTKEIEKFYKLKKKFKFFLIEDACHAFGSEYKIREKLYKVGSCKHSDICTFSFHPLKSITTGEGGCLTTNDIKLAKKMQIFRSHGILRKSYQNYDIKNLGFNYRLSDINSALGLSQLKKLKSFVKKRQQIAKLYISKLNKLSQFIDTPDFDKNSSWHLFRIKIKKNKNKLINYLQKNHIFSQIHYKPINLFSFYKNNKKFKNAEKYYKETLSLPIYYKLSNKDILSICNLLKIYNKN